MKVKAKISAKSDAETMQSRGGAEGWGLRVTEDGRSLYVSCRATWS